MLRDKKLHLFILNTDCKYTTKSKETVVKELKMFMER